MNRKRNVNYIKPEDPHFLKVLKKEAGYDSVNHKFDKLENSEEDFVEDDDSELPQVVVLKKGDLTAEQAEIEKQKLNREEAELKADLNQRVIFKVKKKESSHDKRGKIANKKSNHQQKGTKKQLLSFTDDNSEPE